MKKTLTILLSLMGVAVSEASTVQELFTLTDAAESKALYIPGEEADVLDCSWTFVLTLNPTELAKITDSKNCTEIFDMTFETAEGSTMSTGVGYFAAGGSYAAEFVPTRADEESTTNGYVSGADTPLPRNFSWDNVSGAAITLVISPASSGSAPYYVSLYHYITNNDGTVASETEEDLVAKTLFTGSPATLGSVKITSDAVQSATCYYGSATKEEATALTKQAATGVVPEPTTATLSLLALAALAARRRRK